MATRRNWFEGWRLFGLLTLTLVGLSIWIAAMRQFEVEGVRMVIRFTARTSLLLFCLAFSAAALVRLWPNAWTHWQRRNRRYLGVTFAASHAVHAVAITAFTMALPASSEIQCRSWNHASRARRVAPHSSPRCLRAASAAPGSASRRSSPRPGFPCPLAG